MTSKGMELRLLKPRLATVDDSHPENHNLIFQAKKCAATVGFDFEAIAACNNGEKGETLQFEAAEYFETRFPTHAHSGMFQVTLQHVANPDTDLNPAEGTTCLYQREGHGAGRLRYNFEGTVQHRYPSRSVQPNDIHLSKLGHPREYRAN